REAGHLHDAAEGNFFVNRILVVVLPVVFAIARPLARILGPAAFAVWSAAVVLQNPAGSKIAGGLNERPQRIAARHAVLQEGGPGRIFGGRVAWLVAEPVHEAQDHVTGGVEGDTAEDRLGVNDPAGVSGQAGESRPPRVPQGTRAAVGELVDHAARV